MEKTAKEQKSDDYVGCWEYWRCSEEAKSKCPVYDKGEGKRCWMYTHDLTPLIWELSPTALISEKRKFKSCKECGWYKKMNPENKSKQEG